MAIWPFGRRRSHRRHAQNNGAGSPSADPSLTHNSKAGRDHSRHSGGDASNPTPERRRSMRDPKRKASREAKKLQRDPSRTYSFSPGRNDSIRVTRDQDRPPVPPIPIELKGKGARAQTDLRDSARVGDDKITRSSTQPQEPVPWERMPTLHKKSPQEVARRKSSKRKKEDHDREAEVRAMAAFMPTRPAAEAGSSGRLIKRESRKVRGGLDANNKSSDVSLPLAGSIHSSLSGSENQASFKLSALDMLAPRPTIKYSEFPRYIPPTSVGLERSASKKRRISERVSIPEETLKANKRIDELADDLDAAELRELMERDQKRREKKKVAERIRAERRLTRRQEKQKAEEAIAARDGTPPPVNLDRGVLGREVVGLGIGTSAVITSSKRKSSTSSQSRIQPSDHFEKESQDGSPSPDADAHTPTSERSEPIIETAQVGRISRASMSPPASPRGHARGASSISQMMDLTKSDVAKPAAVHQIQPRERQDSAPTSITQPESSSRRNSDNQQRSSWASFFKRRSKQSKRDSAPSSFSNTSRDSMQNMQSLQQAPNIGYVPMRTPSNIPKRTMSKFREDLPELPLSPPDSRVQSPEADFSAPRQTHFLERTIESEPHAEDPRTRYDTPTSGYRSLEKTRIQTETPTSGHRSVAAPSPEQATLSQSLASIDSEASWLSGRRAGSKRRSGPGSSYPPQESAHSLQKRYQHYSEESVEELGIAEDEYFSRLSPEPDSHRSRRISGNPMPSSDEEDGSVVIPTPTEQARTKWGAVGRTPTLVHREPRVKSREGLLNDFETDSRVSTPEASHKEKRRSYGFDRTVIDEGEGLHRARSVDLGRGHVRKISAGSARLLDVKPKTSTDSKPAGRAE